MTPRTARALPFALLPLVFAGACSKSSSAPAAPTGPVARFNLAAGTMPNFMDVPFPSDIYAAGGKLTVPPALDAIFTQGSEYVANELPKLNGYSRAALALFYVDDPTAPLDDLGNIAAADLDPTTLPADEAACVADASSVFLIDLATGARAPCRAELHVEAAGKLRPLVAVGPAQGLLLEEGHAYAAVLTSRLKDQKGRAVQASAGFADATAAPYAQAIATARSALAGALATDKATIVSIAPYTTNAMTHELFDLRQSLEETAPPPLTWDMASMAPMAPARFAAPVNGQLPPGFTASLDAWLGTVDPQNKLPDGTDDPDTNLPVRAHDQIAALGTGVFLARNYLQASPNGYVDFTNGNFLYDQNGKIVLPSNATTKIWASFAVPKAPMPNGGYPAVILQHGLGDSRAFIMAMANVFASQGWMTVAIDSVTFGARAAEAVYQADQTSFFAGSPGATYAGPDGFGDKDQNGLTNGSTDFFGLLKNIGAIRDQFREASFDTSQLVQVLRSPTLDLSALQTGAAAPKIDTTRIAYVGDSLGAMEGATAAAIEPYVSAWVLNVAGGGLFIELASHSPTINALARIAAGANFGLQEASLNESHPFVTVGQVVTEAGDPLAYARTLLTAQRSIGDVLIAPRNVLQFEVVYDELVPNEAGEALARAAGFTFAAPNVGSNSLILDYTNLANNPWRLTLPQAVPDANQAFHDTPTPGITAIVVQNSPGAHGVNMTASTGTRNFCIPYSDWTAPDPFHHLDVGTSFSVRCPYLATQSTIVKFLDDAFAGNTPSIAVVQPPIRDLDDDSYTDDQDAYPCDPTRH